MTTPYTNYFIIIVVIFKAFLAEHETANNNFFQRTLALWTYHAIENTFIIFDRQLNNNQLKNLPSSIFSDNTWLQWL